MGQKTNPIGLRLGIVKTWDSRWFAKRGYAEMLKEDLLIKRYLKKRLFQAGISRITIERKGEKITIGIKTARPGLVIGRKGEQVDKLSEEMKQLTKKRRPGHPRELHGPPRRLGDGPFRDVSRGARAPAHPARGHRLRPRDREHGLRHVRREGVDVPRRSAGQGGAEQRRPGDPVGETPSC